MSMSDERDNLRLRGALLQRGVVFPAPEAVVLEDLVPERIAAGVILHPGTTVRGRRTLLGPGTELGLAGGGCFQDIACGRAVQLWGGHHQEAVYLDGVRLRGQAEVRAGTLLEEGCQAGQHVGFKMTVLLANSVIGSLVNFCDAIMSGGPSAAAHSEIGSCTALYNFSLQGDKWASIFGDPIAGLLGRSAPVFIGGQSQVVSPVRVGPGTAIAAGGGVRRDVPAGRLYAEAAPVLDQPLDLTVYGPLARKLAVTLEFVACLDVIAVWYETVRAAWAGAAQHEWEPALYALAARQLRSGIAERIHRLDRLVGCLPASIEGHRRQLEIVDEADRRDWHRARIAEQLQLIGDWPSLRRGLQQGAGQEPGHVVAAAPVAGGGPSPWSDAPPLDRMAASLARLRNTDRALSFQQALSMMDDGLLDEVGAALAGMVRNQRQVGG